MQHITVVEKPCRLNAELWQDHDDAGPEGDPDLRRGGQPVPKQLSKQDFMRQFIFAKMSLHGPTGAEPFRCGKADRHRIIVKPVENTGDKLRATWGKARDNSGISPNLPQDVDRDCCNAGNN